MAQVYSTRLFVAKGFNGVQTQSPPPGTLWIVRDIWGFWNFAGQPVTEVHVAGDVAQTFAFMQFNPVDAVQQQFWQGRQVILTSFTVSASGDPVDISISGYQLTLP